MLYFYIILFNFLVLETMLVCAMLDMSCLTKMEQLASPLTSLRAEEKMETHFNTTRHVSQLCVPLFKPLRMASS